MALEWWWFDAGSVYVRFFVREIKTGQVSVRIIRFHLSVLFHHCSFIILTERKGEDLEICNQAVFLFGNQGELTQSFT